MPAVFLLFFANGDEKMPGCSFFGAGLLHDSTISLDSMRGEALCATRGHSGRRATPGGRGQSSQRHRVRAHGQRGSKSRVG